MKKLTLTTICVVFLGTATWASCGYGHHHSNNYVKTGKIAHNSNSPRAQALGVIRMLYDNPKSKGIQCVLSVKAAHFLQRLGLKVKPIRGWDKYGKKGYIVTYPKKKKVTKHCHGVCHG